jgi:hypothetical protein
MYPGILISLFVTVRRRETSLSWEACRDVGNEEIDPDVASELRGVFWSDLNVGHLLIPYSSSYWIEIGISWKTFGFSSLTV